MQKFVDRFPVWLRRILCVLLPFAIFYVAGTIRTGVFSDGSKDMFNVIFGTLIIPPLMGYSTYLFARYRKVKSAKIAVGAWAIFGMLGILMISAVYIPKHIGSYWGTTEVFIMFVFHILATVLVWVSLNKYRSQDAPQKYRLDRFLGKLSPSLRWGLYVLLPLSQLIGIGTASKIVPWAFPYAGVAELFLATLIPQFYVTVLPYYLAPQKKIAAVLCWMAVWQVFLTVCITYFYLNFSSVFPNSASSIDSITLQLFGALGLNLVLCAVFYWILYRKEKRKAHELHEVALSHESPSPLAK